MINVSGPWITQREIDYVTDAVTNAWYSNANMYHDKFEKAFAEYVGRKYAVALPSCTAALHLALAAYGIGEGDEVIVPDITWIATSAPITYVGATPVFADIDPKSWCISAESFEQRITPRTKAVIPVNLYGNMPEYDAIERIAKKHGVIIIEDAAESIGSEYKNRKAGSFGHVSTFSFHGSKTLTTGEGGILLTDNSEILERVHALRDHGRDNSSGKQFWNAEVGFKYKMSSMQAALGLAQLERVEELVARKREIFSWYEKALAGNSHIQLNYEGAEIKNTYWMVTAILNQASALLKEDLIKSMKSAGIDTRPFFYPLSSLPAYEHLQRDWTNLNPMSYSISPRAINLPSGFNITPEVAAKVSQTLLSLASRETAPTR